MRYLFLAIAALVATSCASAPPTSSGEAPVFPTAPLASVVTPTHDVSVELRTAPEQPPTRGVLDVELSLHDANGAPLDGATLDVVPWMVTHGHGTSTAPMVRAEGGGRYWVSGVDAFMPGEWELRVSISGPVDDDAVVALEVQ